MLFLRRRVGQQAGLDHLQVVVTGKVEGEILGHYLVFTQLAVDDHTFDAVDGGGHTPGRITQVAARMRATRAKRTQHTRQTLRPVAGTEGSAVTGDALDEDFFGGG